MMIKVDCLICLVLPMLKSVGVVAAPSDVGDPQAHGTTKMYQAWTKD